MMDAKIPGQEVAMSVNGRVFIGAFVGCYLVLGLASAAPPPKEPDHGWAIELKLKPERIPTFSVSLIPDLSFTGTSQCPAIGTADFTYDVALTFEPPNDAIDFFDKDGRDVLQISHARLVNTSEYASTGNKIIERQDWTRIKENRNGIDGTTGIRDYFGLFTLETMVPSGTADADGTETLRSQGVITLREPLNLPPSDPQFGLATRVDAVQAIGPQPGWYEPFSQYDARHCGFLADGVPRATTTTDCVVTESIVGCPKK